MKKIIPTLLIFSVVVIGVIFAFNVEAFSSTTISFDDDVELDIFIISPIEGENLFSNEVWFAFEIKGEVTECFYSIDDGEKLFLENCKEGKEALKLENGEHKITLGTINSILGEKNSQTVSFTIGEEKKIPEIKHILTVNIEGGSGTIIGNEYRDGDTLIATISGTGEYIEGTTAIAIVAPVEGSGWGFVKWMEANCPEVVMDGPKTCTAKLSLIPVNASWGPWTTKTEDIGKEGVCGESIVQTRLCIEPVGMGMPCSLLEGGNTQTINNPSCPPEENSGGGGSSSGSYARGRVLGVSVPGKVLGAEATCGIYVDKFLRRGHQNDVEAVKKVQKFLNDYMMSGLSEDGNFGPKTEIALKAFQAKHADTVLAPWNFTKPTGIFYQTTQATMNNIMCPDLKITVSQLIPFEINPLFPKKI